MGGCCLVALLFMLGPRVVLILILLFTNWYDAFAGSPLLVPLLGWLFLPYTSMAWMFIYFQNGGQLGGGYLVLLILAVLFDIGVFSGSHRAGRTRRRE